MANERRVLRKLQTPHKLAFEDRGWPVNIGVTVLVAFLTGYVTVHCSEGTGQVSLLGWFTIATLLTGAALMMWLLCSIHHRLVRRGMQLAVVLSLITHAVLLVVIATWPLAPHVAEMPKEPEEPKHSQLTVPDLVAPRLNDGQERTPDFLRPVETKMAETRPLERARTLDNMKNSDPKLHRSFLSDELVRPHPSVSPRHEPIEIAPHEAATESLLSRRESDLPPVVHEPVSVPDLSSRVDKSFADEFVPQSTAIARTALETPQVRQVGHVETAALAGQPDIVMQEQVRPVPVSRKVDDHSLEKFQPADLELSSETRIAVLERESDASQDLDVSVEDVKATASEVQRQSSNVVAENSARPQAQTPIESRQEPDVVDRQSVDHVGPDHSPVMSAVDRHVERSRSVETDPVGIVAVVKIPTLSPPTAEVSQETNLLPQSALSRSIDGVTGIGDSFNLSQSSPARDGPSLVASASATRVKPTQAIPDGPAMQPRKPVDIPKLRTGALRPLSVFQAQPVEVAVVYGAQRPDRMSVTAAATVKRDASDATFDELTAAVGVGTVDMGVQRTVSESGTGRASGGGRPEVNLSHSGSASQHTAPRSELRLLAVNVVPDVPIPSQRTNGESQSEAVAVGQADLPQTAALFPNPSRPVRDSQFQAVLASAERGPGSNHPGQQPTRLVKSSSTVANSQPATRLDSESDSAGVVQLGFEELTADHSGVLRARPTLAPTVIKVPTMVATPGSSEGPTVSSTSVVPRAVHQKRVTEAVFIPEVEVTGPGGLFVEPRARFGVMARQDASDSDLLALSDHRFVLRDRGGEISLGGLERVVAPGFSKRMARTQGQQLGSNPGQEDARIDEAIELGLAFLARHQAQQGHWSLHQFALGKPYQDPENQVALHANTAATGLALLSFLGAGYHHQSQKYNRVVRAGLQSLLRGQQKNGDLFVGEDEASNQSVALYSHGIATIALCEAYGMTLDSELLEPVQRSLDFVVNTQHPQHGGWRYQPRIGSDTSVTGWMMMALKSGQMGQLDVPARTWSGLEYFMETASVTNHPYLFRYNPHAPDTKTQRHGRYPTDTMTAVGLVIRIYTGSRRDNPEMIHGAEYLLENLPSIQKRDTYYWYYATQIMYHMGGKYWETWKEHLFPLLTDSQITEGPLAGSWDPHRPVRDKWARHAGRLYVTTMDLLSLEVAYRHLPIYEDVADR